MGTYGTVRPAVIDPAKDIEIFYNYNATRYSDDGNSSSFRKLNSSYLQSTDCEGVEIPGLYNLRLPLNVFNQKGYYSIYIRPREITATIVDVGSLATYGDVRGVVFNPDSNEDLATLSSNNALVGYRIEYYNPSTGQREDFSRLITSSNHCEGVTQILTNNTSDTTRYRFTTFGSLIFCTVTPSVASSFKPNDRPYIGTAGQKVAISNTKFSPILLELELVEHDADTISYMLEGEQVHDIDHGIITTFNPDREIYHQANYSSLKDSNGDPAYTVKTRRTNIDTTQDINSILGDTASNL